MRVLGRSEPTWSELYFGLELLEELAAESVSSAGWISERERTRFRRTANSRQVLGEKARHGHRRQAPPPDPMTLAEARAMTQQAVEKFLATRI
jgi:hypothetical protein